MSRYNANELFSDIFRTILIVIHCYVYYKRKILTARDLFKNNVSQAKRLDVVWRKYVALSRNHCCTVNIKCHVNRSSGIGADGDGRTRPDEAKERFSLLCENASKNRPTDRCQEYKLSSFKFLQVDYSPNYVIYLYLYTVWRWNVPPSSESVLHSSSELLNYYCY
jgi:hypothetical protein